MEAGTLPGRGNSFQIKINAAAETTFMCPQQKRKPGGSRQAGSRAKSAGQRSVMGLGTGEEDGTGDGVAEYCLGRTQLTKMP